MIVILILTVITVIVMIIGKCVTDSDNSKTVNNKPVNNKKMEMLLDYASLMAKHIQNNLEIDSPLIFYEQIYYLYFLRDIYAIGHKATQADRDTMLSDLISILNNTHKLDYLSNKDIFKNVFMRRYKAYYYLFEHDNYNFSENYFNDVFEYQTAQIVSIKDQNQLTNYDPELNCLDNTKEELHIKSIISENMALINAFMNQQ